MTFTGVNYLAIVIAAVAAWLAGAGWYMALGRTWMAALVNHAGEGAGRKERARRLSAFHLRVRRGTGDGLDARRTARPYRPVFSLRNGIISAAFCWLGFVMATMLVNNSFAKRDWRLMWIDGGHWLAGARSHGRDHRRHGRQVRVATIVEETRSCRSCAQHRIMARRNDPCAGLHSLRRRRRAPRGGINVGEGLSGSAAVEDARPHRSRPSTRRCTRARSRIRRLLGRAGQAPRLVQATDQDQELLLRTRQRLDQMVRGRRPQRRLQLHRPASPRRAPSRPRSSGKATIPDDRRPSPIRSCTTRSAGSPMC